METSLRLCNYCGCLKPYDPTQKSQSKASGFKGTHCWECKLKTQRENVKAWHKTNREKSRALSKAWREANPEKAAAAKARWYAANPGKHKELNNAWYAANPGRRSELSQRYNMRKAYRTPVWADTDKINAMYQEAAAKGLIVDHIIPIMHPLVSGLHVHNNLQLLTKSENSSKNNKFEVA